MLETKLRICTIGIVIVLFVLFFIGLKSIKVVGMSEWKLDSYILLDAGDKVKIKGSLVLGDIEKYKDKYNFIISCLTEKQETEEQKIVIYEKRIIEKQKPLVGIQKFEEYQTIVF